MVSGSCDRAYIEVGRAPAEVAGSLHGAGLRVVVFTDGAAARQPSGVVEL